MNQTNMPKTISKNKAAAEVRHKIKRKMLELEKHGDSFMAMWSRLRAYIDDMADRASKKPGGLGRK